MVRDLQTTCEKLLITETTAKRTSRGEEEMSPEVTKIVAVAALITAVLTYYTGVPLLVIPMAELQRAYARIEE